MEGKGKNEKWGMVDYPQSDASDDWDFVMLILIKMDEIISFELNLMAEKLEKLEINMHHLRQAMQYWQAPCSIP